MSRRGDIAILAVSTTSVLACAAVARMAYGFGYDASGLALDAVLLAPLGWLAVRATHRRVAAWGLCVVVSLLFVLGHAVKLATLGLPITFADAGPCVRLLQLLDGGGFAIVVACIAAAAGALAWAFWPRRGRWPWLLAMVGFAGVVLPLAGAGIRAIPGGPTGPAATLQRVGGLAYAFSSLAWTRRAVTDATGIAHALDARPELASSAAGFARRNVHLILMETTWDPLRLQAFRFSRDPWDPRLRRLWEAGGRSIVLAPVFGGGTANAEFEALCGLPADDENIVFEGGIANALPCLPRLLREAGYATAAYHANRATYWSRDTAYAQMGFARYHARGAYRLRDRDGGFLADASLYAQTRVLLRDARAPYLAYVVSLSGHYPYHRDRARRPDVVTVAPDARMLSDYANALAYSTAALMDHVDATLAADPDALVVAFGDHAPVLGSAPDPYVASGLKPGPAGEASDLYALSSTPLLVIDGRNGPVSMGTLPLYALPARVLALLGSGAPRLPHAAVAHAASHRMFLGHLLAPTPDGWAPCGDATPTCERARRHFHDGARVREDLLRGAQHTLRLAGAPALARPVAMAVDPEPCALHVIDWGPRQAAKDQPFNVQSSGRSAFWLRIEEAHGELELVVAGETATLTVSGGRASASFASPGFLATPGPHPVGYRCGNRPAIALGTFTVA